MLKELLCDPRGCHVTDSFFLSTTVGEKSRDGLIKALQGHLASMACSKHGSRSIDKMWEKGSERGRELIAQELSAKIPLLTSNAFGRFLVQNLSLSTFKRSKEEWRTQIKSQEKNKSLAKDFFADLSSNKRQNMKTNGQPSKKPKLEDNIEDQPTQFNFVVDTIGDKNNLMTTTSQVKDNEHEKKAKKKKKDKAKSYLDDL